MRYVASFQVTRMAPPYNMHACQSELTAQIVMFSLLSIDNIHF